MTEWIVTSSVLILIIVALRYLLRGRISLRVQYALWVVVLLRLLLPVQLGETSFSVLNAARERSELQIAVSRPLFYLGETPDLAMPEVAPDPMRSPEDLAQLRQQLELQYYAEMAQYATPVTPAAVLRAVWLTGIAVTAAWLLLTNLRFAAALRRSRRLTDYRCGKLAVYASPLVETPCLFGLFRPAVYVTEHALADDAVLRHVLAHEETHYRHGDHVWSVLRGVCLVLHWYHPLVWLAAALSRRDAELACDEGTLRRLGESERTAYGETLISLTCGRKKGELLLTATTMTGSKKSLRERITLIARKPKMAVCTLLCALLVVAIAAGCTFTGSREPAEPELAFLELPDTPVDAQVLSAVKTYIIAHADILNDLAEPGFIPGAHIHSIDPSPTGETENGLGLYEVVYYLQCNDPLSFTRLQELSESNEFAQKWLAEGSNGDAPELTNVIHSGFRAQVLAPYTPDSQTPGEVLAPVGILKHLTPKYQLEATLERLQNLQPEELADSLDGRFAKFGSTAVSAWIRSTAEHKIERTEDLEPTFWHLSVYLPANPDKGEGQEMIRISASPTEENTLKVSYRSKDMVSVTFYVISSELFGNIRNAYHTEGAIDAAAMAPYRAILEAEAQKRVDISQNWYGAHPLSAYEIISFQQIDAFRQDGADYAVYHWDAAFLSEDPLNAGWSGGMWLDSQCRIRGMIKTPYLLTRTVNGQTDWVLGADDIPWTADHRYVIDALTKTD